MLTAAMEQTVAAVLQKTAELRNISPQAEVSIVLADDKYIQELNSQYRGINRPTDVLSFALREGEEPEIIDGASEELLGDIVISLETAARQAEEYGHSLQRELAYLSVHGLLHLLGYDHETEAAQNLMRMAEEDILAACGLNRL